MSAPTARSPTTLRHIPLWAFAAVTLVALWFLTTKFLHIYSEAINWDEFALLERADRSLRLGDVHGGGRPGLVTIILMPFVRDCIDSVQAVVNARLLWLLLTIAYLAGVYWLVRRWFALLGRPEQGRVEGMLAVALLAFLPAFVTWSVQVRTDQAALAAAVWGGVFLLSTGYASAAVAGVLMALSLLSTQKGVYVIALGGLLFATAMIARAWPPDSSRRKALIDSLARLAIAGTMAALVLWVYSLLVPDVARLVSGQVVTSSLDTMRWTRAHQGYRIYTVHADRLIVHWILFALLVFWSVRAAVRRQGSEVVLVATCWLVLLLGLVVIGFHGSSFPYFIMTAGLFPAIALSLTAGQSLALLGRMAWPVLVALVLLATMQSVTETLEMLADTQQEQRETLRLVYESELKNRRGYQVEGALFCAQDPDPIPVMFSQDIARRFRVSPRAEENAAEFIAQFRNRPIAYLVESYRLQQFPAEIQRFLGSHYVWYGRSLYLAGFRLDSSDQGARAVDVIVPGVYRWVPDNSSPQEPVLVDNQLVVPLGEIQLAAGSHTVTAGDAPIVGSLILADLPPHDRDGYSSFYLQRQILQLGGRR